MTRGEVAVTPSHQLELEHYRPTDRGATVADTGPKSSVHRPLTIRNQGEGWLRKIGRIRGEPIGVKPNHSSVAQLERWCQTRVDLEAGRCVQHEPGNLAFRNRLDREGCLRRH